MRYHAPLVVAAVLGAVAIGATGLVIAHESQTVKGYDLTFGGADEPLITGERMWLELEIVNNATGEPVANQSSTLNISVQRPGNPKVPLEVSEKHGEPGVYEAPVIFTQAGTYIVHVEGSLEGTNFHTHFETEVHDRTALEYPRDESGTADGNTTAQSTATG